MNRISGKPDVRATAFGVLLTVSALSLSPLGGAGTASASSFSVNQSSSTFTDVYPYAGPYVYTISFRPKGAGQLVSLAYAGSKIGTAPSVSISPGTIELSTDQTELLHSVFGQDGGTSYDSLADFQAAWTKQLQVTTRQAQASVARANRIRLVKEDTYKNATIAWKSIGGLLSTRRPAYIHTHKGEIVRSLQTEFTHSKQYRGKVQFIFTMDSLVLSGPAQYERRFHYRVVVRDNIDRVAYAIDMNTHDGGPYDAHRVSY